MLTGIIKTLTDKGFGFIAAETGDDVFLHASALIDVGFDELQKGWKVQFEVEERPKGPQATHVRVVSREIHKQSEEHKLGELRTKLAKERKKRNQAVSTIRPGNTDHCIDKLSHSDRWLLLIDETGKDFDFDQYADCKLAGDKRGRFVGVLMPCKGESDRLGIPIKERVNVHFTDMESLDEMDCVLQDLLDAPVGIFGVSVHGLPSTRGDRWVSGVMHVINWVLRLLPLEAPTEVRVKVENRFEHRKDSDWNALKDALLHNLTESNSQRYEKIRLDISIVDKTHPCLCYADAVAHTWGSKAPDAKARLRQSGLNGTCLHLGDGGELMRAWDLLKTGTQLDGDAWRQLLDNPDSNTSLGIAGILLNQVRQACEQSPDLWQRYFEATQQHLNSKAINLTQLGKEVQWLASCKPVDAEIPLRLELAWQTAELEASNHNGCIDEAIVSKLESLGEKLFDEDPGLVCQADLVRAVLATNQFQFDQATRALDRWQNTQMAVAGRLHWGRVQSSLGQHAAFRGDFDQAEDYFAQAINAFDGLTDKQVAADEKGHTATYRAIVAIDHPDNDPATVRRHVGEVVSIALDDIRSIAASTEQKYVHHLLLRYLVRHGTSEERAAYLASRDRWRSDAGHPWPLIAAYRGMLLYSTDPAEAILQMREGVALCEGQGPTVGLIGLTLGVIAMGWGAEDDVVDEQDLEAMETLLPAVGDRIAELRQALKTPLDPPESLLAQVLPFNFR